MESKKLNNKGQESCFPHGAEEGCDWRVRAIWWGSRIASTHDDKRKVPQAGAKTSHSERGSKRQYQKPSSLV